MLRHCGSSLPSQPGQRATTITYALSTAVSTTSTPASYISTILIPTSSISYAENVRTVKSAVRCTRCVPYRQCGYQRQSCAGWRCASDLMAPECHQRHTLSHRWSAAFLAGHLQGHLHGRRSYSKRTAWRGFGSPLSLPLSLYRQAEEVGIS
jgi:hypothetical protein